jgi:hypothetical protein
MSALIRNLTSTEISPDETTPVTVYFFADGSTIGVHHRHQCVQPYDTFTAAYDWTPYRQDVYLFSATANPGHVWAEVSFDNNAKYIAKRVWHPWLCYLAMDSGSACYGMTRTSMPKVVLKALASDTIHGFADSMRFTSEHYSDAQDTIPDVDQYGWVPYDSLRIWTLPRGEGKTRLSARFMFRDSAFVDTSLVLKDSIWADWTQPVCSLKVNDNNRFTNSRSCTLDLSGSYDPNGSGSGLGSMRFSNKQLANFLRNSSFATSDSFWQQNCVTWQSSPGLCELTMRAETLLYLYQDIPSDSFAGLAASTRLRLSCDVVSDSLEASGALKAQYVLSRTDTAVPGPNQVCSLAVSSSIPQGYAS